MVHLINFENTQLLIPVMKQRRLSLSESSFYGNTTFKKNSICLSRRGHRLAWSRIPSLLKLLNLAEVLAWGAGGRGFKSHWPHCDISSLIGFTDIEK